MEDLTRVDGGLGMARRQGVRLLQLGWSGFWPWQLLVVLTWCHVAGFDGCAVGLKKKMNLLLKYTYHRCEEWLIFTKWTLLCKQLLDQEIEYHQHPRNAAIPLTTYEIPFWLLTAWRLLLFALLVYINTIICMSFSVSTFFHSTYIYQITHIVMRSCISLILIAL